MKFSPISRTYVLIGYLSICFVGGLVLYYSNEKDVENKIKQIHQISIDRFEDHILQNQKLLEFDLNFLVERVEHKKEINAEVVNELSIEFLHFFQSKDIYDQIRLLDLNGNEIIRVDKRGILPKEALQNKSNRYYFKETLKDTTIFYSAIDLNIEEDKIEQPLKPMLRVAKTLYNDDKQKIGLIVLNFLAENILHDLHDNEITQYFLVNESGFYLKSNDPKKEWGFMFNDRAEFNFKKEFLNESKEIWKTNKGAIVSEKGIFSYHTFKNKTHSQNHTLYLKVIGFVPSSITQSLIIDHYLKEVLLFISFVSLLLFIYNRQRLKAVIAENNARFRRDFLAHMSHEIRTPLNGIIGSLDLINTDKINSEEGKLIRIIKTSSYSLKKILDQILDLSKIESGVNENYTEQFDIQKSIVEIVNLFCASASQKNLKIIVEPLNLDDKFILGDKGKIEQILSNIIGNAVKYTNEGQICIRFSIVKKNNRFRIEIEDTGVGMSEKEMKFVFNNYYQVKDQFSHIKGTGIGLLICKNLVKNLNGEIGVYQNSFGGSTFWFELPYSKLNVDAKSKDASTSKPIKFFENNITNYQDKKILVIDDQKVNLTVIKLMLEKLGGKVTTLTSGKNILNKIDQNNFDFIFLDINMPEVSGIEVLQAIKTSANSNRNSKFIAFTANSMEEDRSKYLKLGFDDYISKPVTLDKLKKLDSLKI